MKLSGAQIDELLRRLERAARKYRRTRLGYEDALGFGCLGALEALETFDPQRGGDLLTHCAAKGVWRMRDEYRMLAGTRRKAHEVLSADPIPREAVCRDEYLPHEWLRRLRPRCAAVCLLIGAGFTRRELAAQQGISLGRMSALLRPAREVSCG